MSELYRFGNRGPEILNDFISEVSKTLKILFTGFHSFRVYKYYRTVFKFSSCHRKLFNPVSPLFYMTVVDIINKDSKGATFLGTKGVVLTDSPMETADPPA